MRNRHGRNAQDLPEFSLNAGKVYSMIGSLDGASTRVRFGEGRQTHLVSLPPRFSSVNFSGMIRFDIQNDVTIIELGAAYESLDDDALEEVGGLILTKATAAEPPWVVLDLSGTQYIGSTFIELMIRAWRRLRDRGGNMALCGVRPFCAEILQATRLDTLLEITETREEAVSRVAAGRPSMSQH